MISIGSSDGRKGLGFGREMEGTELEEGEACFYQKDDYENDVDPDVALSYIDEKLQDVLGHFQKDFEGGVSAENLGAKFGGYGSFLPTYQRSPVWSQPKTPPKVHNYSAPRSPNNFHLEGGRPARVGSASVDELSLPAPKVPSVNGSVKQEAESAAKCELVNKFSNPSDQKTLKVRIKVGSDNSSTQKNAEIYSGLGLDVSPSSSLNDSPTRSEGFLREPRDPPNESPVSIFQTLTTLHGNLLLSPLADDLMSLIEKVKVRVESRSGPTNKGTQASSGKRDRKVLGEKKPKPSEKPAFLMDFKNEISNGARNGVGVPLKNETEINTFSCKELVSNASRLPLLSNIHYNDVDSVKAATRAVDVSDVGPKGRVKDESFSDLVKEEPPQPISGQENGWVEKPNGLFGSNGDVWENKKTNSDDDDSFYKREGGNLKCGKPDILTRSDSNVSKGRKALKSELFDLPPKKKVPQKATSHEEASVKQQSSSGVKKKSKDGLKVESSNVPKSRKSSHANSYAPKTEVKDSNKDYGKAKDRYKEFFGDIELEQGEDNAASDEIRCPYKQDSATIEKNTFELKGPSRERLNVRKIEKSSTLEACPRVASNVAPLSGNGSGPVLNTAGTVAPVVKEDWVCCDKCQKWRLLPLGTNPDSLPEKWLCSMLNWLPGMNRCSFSEEETTKALTALYQPPAPVPAPEGQNTHYGNVGGNLLGASSADGQRFNPNHQHLGLPTMATGGKKKYVSKDVQNANYQDGPTQFANSVKKNPQASVKSRSLSGANQSPTMNEVDFQHSGKSNGSHKQKENKMLERHSVGGIRNKRDTDQDSFRASKKIKTDGTYYTDEDWGSDRGRAVSKVGPSTSSGFSSGKDQRQFKDRRKDSKQDPKASVGNPEDQVQISSDNGLLRDVRDLVKKRKENECQDNRYFMEETSETEHQKEKKARVSMSGGKETSASKGRNMMDQQVRPDMGPTLSQRSLDAVDSAKRGPPLRPAMAATSSSSKVSGSRKKRAIEMKGSPVESVSSSPLRISNQIKVTSTRKCSDGKDDGGSYRSGRVRKDEAFTVNPRGSLESSVLDYQDRNVDHVNKATVTDGYAQTLGQGAQISCKPETSDHCHKEERGISDQHHSNGSRSKNSGKGSSSRSKDKSRSSRSEFDKGSHGISDSLKESVDRMTNEEKSKTGRIKFPEKSSVSSDKVEKNSTSKKSSNGKLTSEGGKRESHSKSGRHDGSVGSGQDQKQNLLLERDGERSSKRLPSDKMDQLDGSGRAKSRSLPPSGKSQNETSRGHQPILGSQKENGVNILTVDGFEGNDVLMAPKQIKKSENHIGSQVMNSKQPTPNGHKVRDLDAPSPIRRDSFSQAAANAVKEAKDLKHLADRLKNSGSNSESTGLYFQAALKFLHGASLLESSNNESTKHGEMIQSIQMYSSTAEFCEFCACEYEKSKDMAAAALAYKCTEVAYLRVIYSSNTGASRDRHELQTALHIAPLGESPSSSASDVDNLNNPATVDKLALAKGVSSPQVAGNHVIAARNRSNFVRLLSYVKDVNFAMEASRKSRIAFEAASSKLEEAHPREGISSVKRALDFNFQDVDGLLRLVRIAMEAISR